MLLLEQRGAVAHLILNRPGQYNSISGAMIDEIRRELERLAADQSVRAVVIGGAGKAFCAGHDLKEIMQNRDHDFCLDLFRRCSDMMVTIQRMPQPVVARVHGIATAAGCQLVAMCDLAVATETSRFATSGVTLGLFCATPGVAVSRNVSRKRALEMLLTGEFIDARTALDWGLVNRVVPEAELDAEVEKLVNRIIYHPREVIGLGKSVFYRQVEAPIGPAYETAAQTMAENLMLEDTAEGIGAFIEKRRPDWR